MAKRFRKTYIWGLAFCRRTAIWGMASRKRDPHVLVVVVKAWPYIQTRGGRKEGGLKPSSVRKGGLAPLPPQIDTIYTECYFFEKIEIL